MALYGYQRLPPIIVKDLKINIFLENHIKGRKIKQLGVYMPLKTPFLMLAMVSYLSFSFALSGCGLGSSKRTEEASKPTIIYLNNESYEIIEGDALKKLIVGSEITDLHIQFDGYYHQFHTNGSYYGKMELEHGGKYHFTNKELCIDDLYGSYCNYILKNDNKYFWIKSKDLRPEFLPSLIKIYKISKEK